jgi:flagellar biosynthetic protein FlhB
MSDEDKSSKTEEASQKRRDEAFEEGTFAKSADIGVVFVLLSMLCLFLFYGKDAATKIGMLSIEIFSNLSNYELNQESAIHFLGRKFEQVAFIIGPVLFICALGAFVAGALQTGLRLTPKVVELKFDKLDPAKGFKNLFSKDKLLKSIGDVAKFALVGFVIYFALKEITNNEIFAAPLSVNYIAEFIYNSFITMYLWFCSILGIIAVCSYIYQRKKTSKDLMMTKQQVKDEHKEQEGDPMMRSARRLMAKRILQKQMLEEVPLADVVVTNPTHYAVALRYETGKDSAPVVVAKGENMFAKRIKALASEHEVPMVENREIARMLFRIGDVGKPIPVGMYQVIAEILSEVYQKHRYYYHKLKSRRREFKKIA